MLTTISLVTALVTALTTLFVTIHNAIATRAIHALVKADATPAALLATNSKSKVPPVVASMLVILLSFAGTFIGCSAAQLMR